MNLRTEINPKFLLRMGLVGLAAIVMTLLCLKDGLITYPAQAKMSKAFLELREENPDMPVMELFEKWGTVAAENEWPVGSAGRIKEELTPYGRPKKPYDINGQFIMGAVAGLFGLIFTAKLLMNRGRWIEADDEGMRSSEGRELKFSQVTELNKKKWDNKGIARVMYEADGQKSSIVLDDCNYMRDTTQAILRHVEAAIGHDKITNGKPEKPLPTGDAAVEEAAAEEIEE